jgi:hypothetical protein
VLPLRSAGNGHYIADERPDLVAAAVLEFFGGRGA